jgi:alpha-galactosidase
VLTLRTGRAAVGGIAVEVAGDGTRTTWSVINEGSVDVALDAVALEWDEGPPGDDPRIFSHGYQSWAPCRARRLGRDEDPSRAPDSLALVRAAYHADPGVAAPGELRSEQVTVLALGGERRLLGFAGGDRHAGTFRVRLGEDGDRVVVRAEAWLGGATLPRGTRRTLHDLVAHDGDDPAALLAEWAALVGAEQRARTRAPFQVGWCSWYHYFHDVTEQDLHDNLARAADWPFEVFQLDDGFQAAIGEWRTTNDRFPGGVEGAAAAIAGAGFTPGIWLAPFLVAPDAPLAEAHPDWLPTFADNGRPAVGMFHEAWGGFMWQLDTTHPGVQAHLAETAAALVAAGYRYLKLDFTFSAAMPGRFHDPTRTPAERVRAGYDAIRAGAGDDVFVLGCGAPLGAVVGVVDGMRIGADVAPWWELPPEHPTLPGTADAAPATRHAFTNTLARAHQHRRLWLNDPDCVMLRRTETRLTDEARRAWALTVGMSGGMVLVSDDLALLGPTERALLDEVLALGAAADEAATTHAPPHASDLLAAEGPTTIAAAGRVLQVDVNRARGAMSPD